MGRVRDFIGTGRAEQTPRIGTLCLIWPDRAAVGLDTARLALTVAPLAAGRHPCLIDCRLVVLAQHHALRRLEWVGASVG